MKIGNGKLPRAVVLGLGQNGLATVRALGRQGVPVIGVDSDLTQVTARTRYCEKVRCPDFKRGGSLIPILKDLGARFSSKAVLFPSGDHSLHSVSEMREMLRDHYVFTFPSKDVVRLTLDKKRFYEFAAKRGFPIPQTFFPKSEDDCESISRQVRYPCIIKPIQPDLGWRSQFPDHKLFQADGRYELLKICRVLYKKHSAYVIQERIPGRDSHLHFSLTYFNADSRPLCMFTGRKLRQYPPRFGTSSMAESVWDPRISEMTIQILSAMKYTGYGSVEFIWDSRDNKFKIIEVSARTWFPHGISSACGLNIEYLAYCDQLGLPKPPVDGFREAVKWIHERRDLESALAYMRSGDLRLSEWLSSYSGDRTYAIFAWDDVMPAVFLGAQLLSVPLRRFLRKTQFMWPGKQKLTSN